ncbi:MAG: ribosomal protein S1p [Acidobacteria bacterium]|nr:ribosomal protein S1p [Acidobacteriota bacterium]
MSESEKVLVAQVESLPEEPKPEEVRLQEPKLEEPPLEEPRLEDPRLEEPRLEEPTLDESRTDEANASAEAEEFSHLLDSYSEQSRPSTGTLLHGHVVNVTESEVIVDVGYKCEGVIPLEEFRDDWGNLRVKPGDAVEVMMESTEERDGYVSLSHQKARRIKVWDDIETAYQRQTPIAARVMEKIKGGLAVDIGVRAFLPGSQVDVKPVRDLDVLLGQEVSCRIIKLNKKRSNIVVSRKLVLEEEQAKRKQHTMELLAEGAVLTGVVKNLTDYGAFVDIGGMDGLLHVTDLGWGRVGHPSEILAVGQEIEVKVLKFDRERGRVSLGMKQLAPDPWLTVEEQFPAGMRLHGKVLNLTDYGAFVELASGVEGLVHVSEMTWSKRLKHPSKIVSPGDSVEVVVLEVNRQNRRISLGLRQTEPNPWETLTERYPLGSIIEGRVRNLTDFGAFVEVEEGIDGLVHVSDLSWTRRVKRPSEVLKKGDTVRAVVLSIDPNQRRLSLGIKQLETDVWETFCSAHQVGDIVTGQVVRKASFGVFVRVADGIEGLCHVSEISAEPGDQHAVSMEVGQECSFRVIKLSPGEKKVGLSVRALQEEPARREPARREPERIPPAHSTSSATTTIQEMMAMKERTAPKN